MRRLFMFRGTRGVVWLTHDRRGKVLPADFAPWKLAGMVKIDH